MRFLVALYLQDVYNRVIDELRIIERTKSEEHEFIVSVVSRCNLNEEQIIVYLNDRLEAEFLPWKIRDTYVPKARALWLRVTCINLTDL